ncbi:MAG: glycosyltransferase [Lacibacter sp.]
MAKKQLHIVSFDVPCPPDYGGVTDVFYRIKALHEAGVAIHLHCFDYGRGKAAALQQYCASVHYYERHEGHKGFSLHLPYIVASRSNAALWQRLQQDAIPVLLEGIHCTYGLHAGLIAPERVAIRLHNVEHAYYHQLSRWERSLVKRAYYLHESRLLKRYEQTLAPNNRFFCISTDDANFYKRKLKAGETQYLPAFIPQQLVHSKPGKGSFCLYHGNLSVAENEKAATWLLEKVFDDLEIPFVVAGKNPSPRLVALAHKRQHTCIVENPGDAEMNDLIEKAQVHVLPSFTTNGVKLKLLHALFSGRHVVANDEMVKGTGLEHLCHVANNAAYMKYTIFRLFHLPFNEADAENRQGALLEKFHNGTHARKLIEWMQL